MSPSVRAVCRVQLDECLQVALAPSAPRRLMRRTFNGKHRPTRCACKGAAELIATLPDPEHTQQKLSSTSLSRDNNRALAMCLHPPEELLEQSLCTTQATHAPGPHPQWQQPPKHTLQPCQQVPEHRQPDLPAQPQPQPDQQGQPQTEPVVTDQQHLSDLRFMRMAVAQARQAAMKGEVPVGVVLVACDGVTILATTHNQSRATDSPVAHAELLAIQAAAREHGARRLLGSIMYSSLEPCPMCAGAILQARLGRLVYSTRQPRLGADGSWVALTPPSSLHPGATLQPPTPAPSPHPPSPPFKPLEIPGPSLDPLTQPTIWPPATAPTYQAASG
ncbi:hypothetical protein QJQ45_029537, partial [Haematococcus lacustris]